MKEYPVGSICIINSSNPEWDKRECTITGRLCKRDGELQGKDITVNAYLIDLTSGDRTVIAEHETLILKRFPKSEDAWCRDVMKKVLEPVEFYIDVPEVGE